MGLFYWDGAADGDVANVGNYHYATQLPDTGDTVAEWGSIFNNPSTGTSNANWALSSIRLEGGTYNGDVSVGPYGSISGGTFNGTISGGGGATVSSTLNGTGTWEIGVTIANGGSIASGTFNVAVTNNGTITGGTFNGNDVNNPIGGTVNVYGTIAGSSYWAADIQVQTGGIIDGGIFSGAITLGAGEIASGTFNGTVDIAGGMMTGGTCETVSAVTFHSGDIYGGTFGGSVLLASATNPRADCIFTSTSTVTVDGGITLDASGLVFDGVVINNGSLGSEAGIPTFNNRVTNSSYCYINNGTFNGEVINQGTILGGTFNRNIFNTGTIQAGTFNGNPESFPLEGDIAANCNLAGTVCVHSDITLGSAATWGNAVSFSGRVFLADGNGTTISHGYFTPTSVVYVGSDCAISGGTFDGVVHVADVASRNINTVLTGGVFNGTILLNNSSGDWGGLQATQMADSELLIPPHGIGGSDTIGMP